MFVTDHDLGAELPCLVNDELTELERSELHELACCPASNLPLLLGVAARYALGTELREEHNRVFLAQVESKFVMKFVGEVDRSLTESSSHFTNSAPASSVRSGGLGNESVGLPCDPPQEFSTFSQSVLPPTNVTALRDGMLCWVVTSRERANPWVDGDDASPAIREHGEHAHINRNRQVIAIC